MMTIIEHLAFENPMKWSAIELDIRTSQFYINRATRWVAMSEIERLLDDETPEEFQFIFNQTDDQGIAETVVEMWSVLN